LGMPFNRLIPPKGMKPLERTPIKKIGTLQRFDQLIPPKKCPKRKS